MSTGEYFLFTVQFGGYKGDNGLPQLTEYFVYVMLETRDLIRRVTCGRKITDQTKNRLTDYFTTF